MIIVIIVIVIVIVRNSYLLLHSFQIISPDVVKEERIKGKAKEEYKSVGFPLTLHNRRTLAARSFAKISQIQKNRKN